MSGVRATVVLPVKNGAPHLRDLLPVLAAQVLDGGLEVLAIDSGSTDGSTALLEQGGVRTIRIPPEAFDHGVTRNLGAREARGPIVLFLSQDALPADEQFARRLVEAVEADGRVAGAFARQRPRPDADPLTRRDLEGWVAGRPDPHTTFVTDRAGFEALPPLERYTRSVFDNVASAVRRGLLLEHPFAPTPFGEDVEWGQRMLRLGHGLAYVPGAVVVHSHRRSARALYRRNYLGHRLLRRLFGLRTVRDAPHLVRAAVLAVARDVGHLLRAGASPTALVAAPAQSVAAVLGQYRGARDEAARRPYPAWSRAAS
jgi:glycosyltransferase involved in cell wall biosynthesis